MRLSLFIVLLAGTLICSAQKNSIGLEVQYQEFQEINLLHTYTSSYATLYALNNTSIYKVYDNVEFSEEKAFKKEEAKPFDSNKKMEFSGNYLKIDNRKKDMQFFNMILNNKFLVNDIYHEFEWNISTESKNIGGYQCLKATTNYRGREWVAWFTQEIPMPFGPWKLHGLPGLIVEAYDSKNEVTYKAVKIENKKNDLFDKDFKTLVETKNTKALSYRQFLDDRAEAFDNMYKEIQSQNPGVTYSDVKGGVPRTGPELKYEWEK